MLPISPAKVAHVIIRARQFDAGMGAFEGGGSRAAGAELAAFVKGLNEEEKAALVAVFWIGRGTYGPDELAEAIETARAEASTPTEDYLMGVPLLADYLEDGLEALGLSVEDAEDSVLRMT
ncbi:DUF3775 domain-containing protein [Phaeovulum vinaykumarii]|uniref:DUF3775 domain-containing protein n=1 Tax=Phaeovulum vinaykumarii TaxID=407234 RepID=A0A1N7MM26_9RHOB|nr:DUF3775 domain-containing protein [Phaeovulum vinaykumarii]SIS87070.1 Protein of unknown function [Phaeovulum vinaykumarii]SOC13307.1 uncharacterized protein DUF3775 [Phaeovulum vinaykumarii]